MEDSILNWLLEDENPEVKLRTFKEALHFEVPLYKKDTGYWTSSECNL